MGPLFYPLWVRSFGFFSSGSSICSFHPVCCLELLLTFSGVAVCECVSLAPRAPYTPSFAVWCLGLSRACVLLLRSSWHSMSRSRSSWHSMSRSPWHGSPASLSDELFARPRADPRVLFPHASSRAARGCVWFGCTQHHSLPSPPRAPRVEGVVFRLVVNSAMPCLWPLLRVAGNTSLLEPVPRRSVSQTANCTSRQALLCLVSRDRPQWSFLPLPALCRRWFGFHRFGLRAAVPPKLSLCDSSQLSPLRLAVCLVVSGHSSTQTCSN